MSTTFTQTIQLQNNRVLLRPLQESDFELLLPFAENEPELWNYSLVPANGAENLKKYIALALEDKKLGKSYPFLVIDKQSNEIAGSTRFYDFQQNHQTVQLGYTWYGKKFQGTGLNKNCKFLLLEFAFENWNLERVEFRADFQNKKSIAAMKSIGCVEEGILRSNCKSATGRRDSIVLSILKNEWFANVKNNLIEKIN